ncbi:MAG: FAD-binding oxidoreductase [Paludibacterium sp.]|uniref:NAD(P)/FAD-dependent oxidoreductase n=1 Tax=Paludibacterium sp. TaxID=1917523 RepID=UPI0025D2B876|nr:FAD-binding oxidoreductase [Paludibacterium sp.]MBV8047951.1 FAD-binding oxidoreductase [Paludibacterium sp.]MBV8647228.1 FAD-binding oxidoreductase [Paludibacterium sp.]
MLQCARQPHVDSYYAATATPWVTRPPLDGDARFDVCVIGGGLAGVSTALNLAERGFKVGLLEGSQIGFAASGRNGGQVISGFACDMDTLRRQAGDEYARAFWDMSVEAVEIIDARVKQHAIDCDWTRGYCTVAVKPRQLRALAAWQREAETRYGYRQYDFWERDRLRGELASERYVGGLYDPLAGHLHPLNYTLGLARAAEAAGVTIFENTPVQSIVRAPSPQAVTASGTVSCQHLVLACNVFGGRLAPELASRIMPVGTYVIATEPLGPARARSLIANNMAVCDSNFVLDYYRLSADQRVLFGGKVSYTGREPRQLGQAMRQDMLRVFPQLADVRIDYAWGGFVDITMSRAPDFGRLDKSIYYLQGFSGHGVNITGIAGKMLAEAIAQESTRLELFSRLRHRPFPGGTRFAAPALALGMLYYRLMDYL